MTDKFEEHWNKLVHKTVQTGLEYARQNQGNNYAFMMTGFIEAEPVTTIYGQYDDIDSSIKTFNREAKIWVYDYVVLLLFHMEMTHEDGRSATGAVAVLFFDDAESLLTFLPHDKMGDSNWKNEWQGNTMPYKMKSWE